MLVWRPCNRSCCCSAASWKFVQQSQLYQDCHRSYRDPCSGCVVGCVGAVRGGTGAMWYLTNASSTAERHICWNFAKEQMRETTNARNTCKILQTRAQPFWPRVSVILRFPITRTHPAPAICCQAVITQNSHRMGCQNHKKHVFSVVDPAVAEEPGAVPCKPTELTNSHEASHRMSTAGTVADITSAGCLCAADWTDGRYTYQYGQVRMHCIMMRPQVMQ